MAEEVEQSFLVRFFWPIAVVVLALVVTGFVLLFKLSVDHARGLRTELNAHYVEKIELSYESTGTRGGHDLIVIDGVTRRDCKADDEGYLTCSEDPQPTPEH